VISMWIGYNVVGILMKESFFLKRCCVSCSGFESPDLSAPPHRFFCRCVRCWALCSLHRCSSLSVLATRVGAAGLHRS
jgi:hypothetical protein